MANAKMKSDDIKRHPINVRTTLKVRNLLEAAAAASGRSMSQELEFRIERSLEREAMIAEQFGSLRRFAVGAHSADSAEYTSMDARDLLQAIGAVVRHADRLLASNPVSHTKVNGAPQFGMDDALQVSAGIIALLQAVNGMDAAGILEEATAEYTRKMLVWREAAVAATAQALGTTVADAAKLVDLGKEPPKFGPEVLYAPEDRKKSK